MTLPITSDPSSITGPNGVDGHDEVISITELGVRYRLPNNNTRSLKDFAIKAIKGQIKYGYFWALKDINLTVQNGEIVGLVGHNGAGKSTLLKVISRILKPTEGRMIVRGTVAPLLGVTAAFHLELSGRENVLLYGSLLGFSRQEMEEKFDRIVDFAELWDYIDQPLRTYSSGMRARLGFSVATDSQPDILIVDEILSVGDEAFRIKSEDRMKEFRDRGTTILLVTHSMAMIKEMCHRAVWIHQGRIRSIGESEHIVDKYVQERLAHRKKQNPRLRA